MCTGVYVGMVFCDLSCHAIKADVLRRKLYVEIINSFSFFMTLLVLFKISFLPESELFMISHHSTGIN